MKVAVIGLGIMGSAMAANLTRAGHAVQGYDVLADRRAELQAAGGTPVACVERIDAPVIITSLPGVAALHEVSRALAPGAIVVETSTLALEGKLAARDLLQSKGCTLLDCPLSGTGAQARTGDLVVYGSGERDAYLRVVPLLEGFARSQHYLGEFGNGSRMKYVANLLVAIHNVAAAEAFALGIKAGLDPQTLYEVVGDGAGASRMFQVRGPQMVAGHYEPATMKVDVWQKDMQIIGEYATRLGVPTPLFNASAALYTAAMGQGLAKQDTAAVCAVLEKLAGIER